MEAIQLSQIPSLNLWCWLGLLQTLQKLLNPKYFNQSFTLFWLLGFFFLLKIHSDSARLGTGRRKFGALGPDVVVQVTLVSYSLN